MNEKEIDAYIGKRLRTLRNLRGMSQVKLSQNIGVSFQQIQKYENGKNRMGGSRIYQMANIMEVSPLYFFEGLPGIDLQSHATLDPETAKVANLIQNMDDKSKKIIGRIAKLLALS